MLPNPHKIGHSGDVLLSRSQLDTDETEPNTAKADAYQIT